MISVQEGLRFAIAELTAAGVGSRWLNEEERNHSLRSEAETLLLWATGWSRSRFVSSWQDELPAEAYAKLQEALEKRKSGLPLQYATGQAAFYGRLFSVRPGCLIPRPETELLADLAVDWIGAHRPSSTVADLGTGSGILAVTIRLECSQTTLYALDLSRKALDIARENAHLLGATPGIQFVHTDGLHWLKETPVSLNVLVSNPPYIPSKDVDELDAEVRLHEPRLALDGGEDGLEIYRVLSELGDARFAPGPAAIFLEVGEGQAESVLRMMQHSRWENWTFAAEADLRGVLRVVWGYRRT